jgi:hypothetical protein
MGAIGLDTSLTLSNRVTKHGFVVGVTVAILFSVVGLCDTLLQSVSNGTTGFRCDAWAR